MNESLKIRSKQEITNDKERNLREVERRKKMEKLSEEACTARRDKAKGDKAKREKAKRGKTKPIKLTTSRKNPTKEKTAKPNPPVESA